MENQTIDELMTLKARLEAEIDERKQTLRALVKIVDKKRALAEAQKELEGMDEGKRAALRQALGLSGVNEPPRTGTIGG